MSNHPMTQEMTETLSKAIQSANHWASRIEDLGERFSNQPTGTDAEADREMGEQLIKATRNLTEARTEIRTASNMLVRAACAEYGVTEDQARDYVDSLLP